MHMNSVGLSLASSCSCRYLHIQVRLKFYSQSTSLGNQLLKISSVRDGVLVTVQLNTCLLPWGSSQFGSPAEYVVLE